MMPVQFEDREKCDGDKILAGISTILAQFESIGKFDGNKLFAISSRIFCRGNAHVHGEPISFILNASKNAPFFSFSSVDTMPFSKCDS